MKKIFIMCFLAVIIAANSYALIFTKNSTNGFMESENVIDFALDHNKIFIATKTEVYLFNFKKGLRIKLTLSNKKIPGMITSIAYSKKYNKLFIATNSGLEVYNLKTKSVNVYTTDHGLLSNDIRKVYISPKESKAYLAFFKGKVQVYDIESESLIGEYMTGGRSIDLPSAVCVKVFKEMSDGSLWHGTNGSGIHIMDNSGSFKSPEINFSSINWTTEIIENNSQVYIGTSNGIYKTNLPFSEPLQVVPQTTGQWIKSMTFYNDFLLFATNKGIFSIQNELLTDMKIRFYYEGEPNILKSDSQILAIGTSTGAYIYNYISYLPRMKTIPNLSEEYDKNTVIGIYKKEYKRRFLNIISSLNLKVLEEEPKLNAILLKLPPKTNLSAILKEFENKIEDFSEKPGSLLKNNKMKGVARTAGDPFYIDQLNYVHHISLEKIWKKPPRIRKIPAIAVLDTGIDFSHPEFKSVLKLKGKNFVNWEKFEVDRHGHGTFCTGIICAKWNNGIGIKGALQANRIRILPVKVLSNAGYGTAWTVARGIVYAIKQKVDVISMSLGCPADSPLIHEAIKLAYKGDDSNIVFVAAAGNYGRTDLFYPAAYSEVLSVGSIDYFGLRSWFSNFGPQVDCMAPGEQIISIGLNKSILTASGTSCACPYVAALAGLIKGIKPELRAEKIKAIILQSCFHYKGNFSYNFKKHPVFKPVKRKKYKPAKPEFIPQTGYGIIDYQTAISLAKNCRVKINHLSDKKKRVERYKKLMEKHKRNKKKRN